MTQPAVFTFDVAYFRQLFPAFADPMVYSDAQLAIYWNIATNFISPTNYGWLNGQPRFTALNFCTAHLAALSALIATGIVPSMGIGASVDKVHITLQPPPLPNQWQWWLGTTGYGQQLLALLQMWAVGGWMVGGAAERGSIRQAYGIFPGPNFP
jgi:hypothetical protein